MIATDKKKILKPNNEQQQCIDNINGKYLVLAGPGTGKTFTVIQRIKAMIGKDNGIDPNKILCLTFSEAAAEEMKKKLDEAFETVNPDINIYTYHSFCNEIITNNAELFDLTDNYKVINNTIKQQFLKECIDELKPIYLRNDKNDPYSDFARTFKKFSQIKKARMSKEEYFNNIKTNEDWQPKIEKYKQELEDLKQKPNKTKTDIKNMEKIPVKIQETEIYINKAIDVWNLYELFTQKMNKESYIDFDDMIAMVIDKFETSPSFLDTIANKYEYIMVDEYQDTNDLQNAIVFNLVSALKSQNIFVVGDDDQIIFSFQGASLDSIGNFLTQFPDTQVICLKDNMRSTQSILDVAREIAKKDTRRLEANPKFKKYNIDKKLIAKNEDVIPKDKKVRLTIYNDQEQEFIEIVDEIKNLIESEECPKDNEGRKKFSEIAIICTGHDDLKVIADMLKDKNIPYELKDGKSIYEIKSSITLFYYLQMLSNPELYSDKILKLLLLPPFEINPIDFSAIHKRISIDKTFIETMRILDGWYAPDKIENFLKIYDYLKHFNSVESVRNVVLEVGAKTGIFKYFLNEDDNRVENIAGLKKLVDEASAFSDTHKNISLEAFVEYLIMIQDNKDLDILTDKPPITQNAVQLTTYHSSKGKEYEYVYMPTLQPKRWESSSHQVAPQIPVPECERKDEQYWKDYRLSDRIKNMYVGMTRAKYTLRLSYIENGSKKGSKWIKEISNLTDNIITEEYNLENYSFLVEKAITKKEYDYKRDFSELINNKIKNKSYSPTAINNYISCPRKYLYENILKLEARNGFADAANYGSAVHFAFDYMIKEALKTGEYPTKEMFILKFKEKLDTLPLSCYEQREILEGRGEKELSNYYQTLISTFASNLYQSEYELKIDLDGVKFKGFIDKVEKNDDGTFTLIDYKTGKKRGKTEICPDGVHEDYYNQICLYKYYFEKQENAKVKNVQFVFPINSYHLSLEITDEECQKVVDKFKNSIKKIENCEFQATPSEKSCGYCQYKDFCMMNVL